MTKHSNWTIPLCACGRMHIKKGALTCSQCRREGALHPRERKISTCIDCGGKATSLRCRPCDNIRKQLISTGQVAAMRAQHMTFVEIGEVLGVTRQRAQQILRRDKSQARQAASRAISTGKLVRPNACTRCGMAAAVQAHHHDYSRPLDVDWLCQTCHGAAHVGAIHILARPAVRLGCALCSAPISKRNQAGLCQQCRWIEIPCESCGAPVRRLASRIATLVSQDRGYTGRVFCNRDCFHAWNGQHIREMRKTHYWSAYPRKVAVNA